MAESKTQSFPSYQGKQYDENTAFDGSHADSFTNELPNSIDQGHTNTTAGTGSPNFSGGSYDNEHNGGYGVEVGDQGKTEATSYSNDSSTRGQE